jgi:type I restriction enzyme S subunit
MKNKNELPTKLGYWANGKIGNLVNIRNGFAFKSGDFKDDDGINVIRQTNLSTVVVNFDKPKYLPESFLITYKDYLIEKNDVLIGLSGSIGNLSRYLESKPALQNQRTGLLVENYSGAIQYVQYYLQLIKKDLLNAAKGVAVQNISSKTIENWHIPIAPVAEQKLIVEKIEELFSHIDAGVAGLKQAKTKLQQYRQSVLIEAVTGKLTEQWREQNADKLEPADELLERILQARRASWEAEQLKGFAEKGTTPKNDNWKEKYKEPSAPELDDVPEIPSDWCYLRLESIAEIQGGITVDAKRKPDDTTLLPYLRVANVQRGFLDLSKMKDIQVPNDKVDELLLQSGDILFNEGGDRDKLGRGWVWRNEIERCIYQNHVFRARLFSDNVISEFISIFGNTIGKEYFIKQGKQTTNLASINKTKLSAFPVPVCSKSEMKEIMEVLGNKILKTDRTLDDVDSQIIRAEQLKSSILSKAFSGELVENIETDESAEQLLQKIYAEKELLEQKTKLAKKKPTARANKMQKRPIIDVLKESKKALKVDELFELAGFQNDVSPEGIEAFYQELKTVAETKGVEVTPIFLDTKKQGDKFLYKEVKKDEAR